MAEYEYLGILNWDYDPIPDQFWSWGDPMDDFRDYWGSWTWVGYPEGSTDFGMLYEPGPCYDFRWVEVYYWPDRDVNVWLVFHIAETFYETGIEVPVTNIGNGDAMSSQPIPSQLGGGQYQVARWYNGSHRTLNEEPYSAFRQACTWTDAFNGIHNNLGSYGSSNDIPCGGDVLEVTEDTSVSSTFRMWLFSSYFPTFTVDPNQYRYLASKAGVVIRRNMQWYGYRPVPTYRPTDWNVNWFTGWVDADGNPGNNWTNYKPQEFVSASVKFQVFVAGVSPPEESKATTAYIEKIEADDWAGFTSPAGFPIGDDIVAMPIAEGEGPTGSASDHTTWEGAVTTYDFGENDLDDGEHLHLTFSESFLRGAAPDLYEPQTTVMQGHGTGASLSYRSRFLEVIVRGNWRELHIVPCEIEIECPPHLRLVQRQDRALGHPGNVPTAPNCEKAVRLLGRGEVNQNLTPGKSPRVYIPNSYF